MKWVAYIAERCSPKKGEYRTEAHRFELDNTTKADMRVAILHAALLYNADPDRILCLPDHDDGSHYEGVEGVMKNG